jgi:glyoxylase-like metal-dependent hydrolase (beta-lactamase superfamily II)
VGAGALLPYRSLLVTHGNTRRSGSVADAGLTEHEGVEYRVVVLTGGGLVEPHRVLIDPVSHLVAAVQAGSGAITEFSAYRAVAGIQVPHRRVVRANGVAVSEVVVAAVDLSPALGDARFAVPDGYSDPPAAGAPRATALAEGVYRLDGMPGGYHALFVVAEDHVVVLEAPISAEGSAAALAVIRATAPDRPVRRVMLSHHHGDHVAGAGAYVADGATLVVGAGLEEAVRRQLPEALRADVRFDAVDAPRTFGGGAARIEAYPVPNGHAEGNVAYFLPASGILFQGDLFYIPERGPVPPAFDVTADLDRVIRTHDLGVRLIVGVHGRAGTLAELKASLDRR